MKSKILALIAIICIIAGVMGGVFFGYQSFTHVMMDAKVKRYDSSQVFEYFTTGEEVATLNLYGDYDRVEIEVQKVEGNTLRVYGTKEMSYEQTVKSFYDNETGELDLTFQREFNFIDPFDMFGEEDATMTMYEEMLNEMVNGNSYIIGQITIEVPKALDLIVKTDDDIRLTVKDGACLKDRLIVEADYGKVNLPRELELEEFEYTTKSQVSYDFVSLSKIKKMVLNCERLNIYTYGDIETYNDMLMYLPEEIKVTGETVNITSYGPIAKKLYINTSRYAEYISDFTPYKYSGIVDLYKGEEFAEDDEQPKHEETFIPLENNTYEGIISEGEGDYIMEIYSEYQGAVIQRDEQSLIHELIKK